MTDRNRHRNDERTVACPVCGTEVLARGLHLHVRQSAGGGHGEQGEVPDDIDLDNVKDVGTQEVAMDYPEERETEEVARLCPYCGEAFSGKNGVLIHLGQVAGRKNHPPNASEVHTPEDFPVVELDENENIVGVVSSPRTGSEEGDTPKSDDEAAFACLTKDQINHLYRAISEADIEDESVHQILQRAYLDASRGR